jgi:hypothetical protein
MAKIQIQVIEFLKKHLSLIKGLVALIFGISLVYLSHKLIINLIVFSGGMLLIYYGLVELKLRKITDFIDGLVSKLKR